jgi:glycine cleavage system aminomethyltransferase T
LFHNHQRSGASLIEHYGWQVPARFTAAEEESSRVRGAAGLADLSWVLKFDLKGFGLKSAPTLPLGAHRWALAPLHVLITCDPSARQAVMESLQALQAAGSDLSLPPPVYITDVTSVYAQFLLAGPRCRDILCKLTSLNLSESSLPDLSCGQASLAHVRAIILRKDVSSAGLQPGILNADLKVGATSTAAAGAEGLGKDFDGIPAYHLLVSREYGESVWDSVLHAGDEFGLAPFGLKAQQLLRV